MIIVEDILGVLQKYIGFYGEKDELRKAKVNSMREDRKYIIQYLDTKDLEIVDLEEENTWKYLYTPEQFIEEMTKSIMKFTKDNPINGYHVIYERKHKPLEISYYDGYIHIKFSIGDFNKYMRILDGVDNTIEDIFCLDGVIDFENKLVISHEYCTLSFKIPEHYRDWALVE